MDPSLSVEKQLTCIRVKVSAPVTLNDMLHSMNSESTVELVGNWNFHTRELSFQGTKVP